MLPSLLIFLPFAAGIADSIIARRSEKGRDLFAVAFSFLELLLSILLVIGIMKEGGFGVLGMKSMAGSTAAFGLQIPYAFGAGLSFTADGFRSVYSLVTSLMWAFTTLFSLEYFRHVGH